MHGNEIDRLGVCYDPLLKGLLGGVGHSRCWSSDAALRTYATDGLGCRLIQAEVFFERMRPETANIRLVPDLEIPLVDFRLAVALFPVRDQRLYQRRPLR